MQPQPDPKRVTERKLKGSIVAIEPFSLCAYQDVTAASLYG
jgi:hypothetical protein